MLLEAIHETTVQTTSPVNAIVTASLLLGVIVWKLQEVLKHFIDFPKTKYSASLPTILGSWITSVQFLFNGPEMLQANYNKAGENSFAIPTPENYHVVLPTPKHAAEILAAPQDSLSFHAVITDLFRPRYTMGMELSDDPGQNDTNIHMRVLRVLLTSFSPTLQPALENMVARGLEQELERGLEHEGGWKSVKLYPMAQRLITKLNALMFFGEELANNPEHLNAALQYPMDIFVTSEVIRLLPSFLSWPVATLMTRRNRNLKTFRRYVYDLVEQRIADNLDIDQSLKPHDCVQWLIDSVPKEDPWPTDKIVSKIVAIWFGSVHILAMTLTYAIYDLRKHSKYVEPLRQEIMAMKTAAKDQSLTDQYRSFTKLPLLDGFLKESARLHPATAIGIRRKAVTAYTFSDGTYVPAGDWVCVPQQAIQRDPQYYPNPGVFDAFRFVPNDSASESEEGSAKRRTFTDIEFTQPIWGMGKRACPGRFYAALVMKLVLAEIVMNFDIRFADEKASRSMTWGTVNVPRNNTRLLFKRTGSQACT